MDKGAAVIKGIRRNGLYVLMAPLSKLVVNASVSNDKTKLWHMRLGYMSERGLKELEKQGLFVHDHISHLEFCERCVVRKTTRQKFNPGKHETKQTLDYVHSDI